MEQGLVLQIMTKDYDDQNSNEEKTLEIDNYCEECKKEDESVTQNLILIGFKVCKSCRTSKTIFPL